MTDDNEDFEIDNDDLPANDVDEQIATESAEDDDDDFDFSGLTQAEIDAINANDDDEEESVSQEDNDDSADKSDDKADGVEDTAGTEDTDASQQEALQAQSATLAEKRAALDTDYEAEIEKLKALGEKWDDGAMQDGAYHAEKAVIDRNIKRIEAREAMLISQEDSINERQSTAEQQEQDKFIAVATAFFDKPENSVFVQGSPEHAALSQQYDFAVANSPKGTPYETLLAKARTAVGVHMTLPEVTKEKPQKVKPEDKIMPSISGMPSAVANNPDASKYQHLDKLSGQDYENAIAGMSEDQQRQYLHG